MADELVFLDITASHERRRIILDVVARTAEQVFMPLTVGGGVRSIEDIRDLLNAGADKVSINTAAVKDPDLITRASARFGRQCIVVAIDPKMGEKKGSGTFFRNGPKGASHKRCLTPFSPEGEWYWEVHVNGGRTPTSLDALKWAVEVEQRGAGEILLTSMDADGTKDGYDIPLTCAVSSRVGIPVIASGGAGRPEHFYEVLTKGRADAALAASIFHYREYTIAQVKSFLAEKGVPVRRQ
jgi:cyclase